MAKILIVDDEEHIRFLYSEELTEAGYEVITADGGYKLLERIEAEKPDTVCVELCQSRYDSLTQKKKWENTDLLKVIKEKKAFLLLSNLLLASFQRKIGQKLGIRPGEEILQAIRSAEAATCSVWPGPAQKSMFAACVSVAQGDAGVRPSLPLLPRIPSR